MTNEPLLKWTGHPLADVGVATLCAMAGKADPSELALEDLDRAGAEIADLYSRPILLAYLSCVFTINAKFTNPTMKSEKRAKAMRRLTLPYRSDPDPAAVGGNCIFSGEPATHLLDRTQMPMITGENVFNFVPSVSAGLLVAAPYLLAIQAIPLGGRRTEGNLMIVHCDAPEWTLQFASRYLGHNRMLLDLAKTGELPEKAGSHDILQRDISVPGKYPDAKQHRSLIMDDLVDVMVQRHRGRIAAHYTSVSVYLLNNSQTPWMSVEHIPSQLVEFLLLVHGPRYHSKWLRLVHRAWRHPKEMKNEVDQQTDTKTKRAAADTSVKGTGPGRSRNDLYNDLLPIFIDFQVDWRAATRFIRRHLLCDPRDYFPNNSDVPRFKRLPDRDLIDWGLTTLFLQEALGMNNERIQRLTTFADRLSELILDGPNTNLFRQLVYTKREDVYRSVLTRAQRQYAKDHNELLFRFDEFLYVFLPSDSGNRLEWSLCRDLISIRLIEKLFDGKFFEGNEDLLVEDADETSQGDEE